MSVNRAVLRCESGCPGSHTIFAPIYRCPHCDGLLRVVHDLDGLRSRSAEEWKRLFEARYKRAAAPYGSGVWGKKEWVCPEVRDEHIVSFDEGGTSLLRVERFGAQLGLTDLWIKMSGSSHTGSFKDLGMTVLISVVKQMIADGAEIRAVACASSGDTSAALAAYAAAAGIPALVILPRGHISAAQLVQPAANGALVLSLDTDFDGCMALVGRLAAEGMVYLANSLNSVRLEGQKTVSFEIAQQLNWEVPDVVVVPGGNLGNVTALAAGFELMRDLGVTTRLPRLVVAQAESANPLYRSYRNDWRFEPMQAQPTLATAIRIGDPVSIHRAIDALQRCGGIVEQATEEELADAAARLDRVGFLTCPQTAVAVAAVEKLAARGAIGRSERAVVISTATGLKFVDFKTRYHARSIPGVTSRFANPPREVRNDYGAVRQVIEEFVSAGRENVWR